jgi:hypothetical protein
VDVAVSTAVSLTWSLPMETGTSFDVSGPSGSVSGTFSADASNHVITFTPDAPLAQGTTYTISASGQVSNGVVQQVPVSFSFTTFAPSINDQFDALIAKLQMLTDAGEFPGRVGQNLVLRAERAQFYYGLGFYNPTIQNLIIIINVTDAMENAGFLSAADAAEVRDLATGLIAELSN